MELTNLSKVARRPALSAEFKVMPDKFVSVYGNLGNFTGATREVQRLFQPIVARRTELGSVISAKKVFGQINYDESQISQKAVEAVKRAGEEVKGLVKWLIDGTKYRKLNDLSFKFGENLDIATEEGHDSSERRYVFSNHNQDESLEVTLDKATGELKSICLEGPHEENGPKALMIEVKNGKEKASLSEMADTYTEDGVRAQKTDLTIVA